MTEPATFAILWRRGRGAPWRVQPYLRLEPLAIAEAEKLMVQFGRETAISPCATPAERDR